MKTDKEIEQQAQKWYGNTPGERSKNIFINGAKWMQEQDNWISVKDKLPEKSKSVIILRTCPDVVTVGYIHERGYWIISNMYGSTYKENHMHFVTHWQPLPEPPKK